ncbi:MAG: cytochrome c, partial [Acidimicrobiia bacterium]|nr:cytochrome c [Acidimicrobiia bacterium]
FAAAREHFADHCASCHANDGSGHTEMGRNFYPKVPDMRLPRTQDLSDGELFYIIENGVMLTGMPGWSTGTPEGERSSWQLVHFIRRLSKLTPDDFEVMLQFNPVSRAVIEEERTIEDFLSGGDEPPPAADVSRRSPEGAKADPHAAHKQ